jgi:cob(I)alamin adenosyltransferase
LESLDSEIRTIESGGSVRADWSVPGEDAAAAAMDLARAVCRRAERHAVGLAASGEPVAPNTIRYLNRLSDLLWLFSRQLESAAGVDGALRDADDPGKPWSPAW